MAEFQSNDIRSRNYNYTVDYFELRAQPGRDGNELAGDQFWYRDEVSGILYPLYLDDALVIGGSTLRGTESLRVVGDIDATGLIIGGSYIREVANELTFYDVAWGHPVTLSDLMMGLWTQDDTNHWLYPTNANDSLLLGGITGSALKRLQMKSENNDGSSYLIYGENSLDTLVFSVNDLGTIALYGDLYFGTDGYIEYNDLFNFWKDGTRIMTIDNTVAFGPDDTWRLNTVNPFYSFQQDIDTGFGLPSVSNPAIYIDGTPMYSFTATQFSLPQEAWIYSGINLLRVNASNQIELGSFVFDGNENKIYLDPNTYIYSDIGLLWFYDEQVGYEISLAQLASQANVVWERDNIESIITPINASDALRLPALATGSTQSLYIDNLGTIVAGNVPANETFTADISVVLNSTKSLGKYVNGDTIPAIGKTVGEVLIDIALEYISASFSLFSVSQSSTVEIGTTLSGNITFSWGFDVGSGQVDTLDIYDITDASDIATAIGSGTSPQSITINTLQLNADGSTQQWRGIGTDVTPDPDVDFNSNTFTVTSRYYRFYGPVDDPPGSPTDSASVRALPSSDFQVGSQTFILNTGSTLTKFIVALPPGKTITSVIDLDSLNANIVSEYVPQVSINVSDEGGTARAYNIYEMNVGVPYSLNHRHSITTS